MRVHAFRYGGVLASAILFVFATRLETPWSVLMWVALVPWIAALERERTMRGSVVSASVMSTAFVVAVFAWFPPAIARYTGTSPYATFALLLIGAPLFQPQFLVFAAVRSSLFASGCGGAVTAVGAACAWVATERLCPRLFGDTLGHGLYPFAWLRQGADLAGASGLTFVILLVNETALVAVRELRGSAGGFARATAPAAVLIVTLAAYGAVRSRQVDEVTTAHEMLAAALVQGGLQDYDGLRTDVGSYAATREILDSYEAFSRQVIAGQAADTPLQLLIWPETVYPTTFGKPKSAEGAAFDDELRAFVAANDVPLLFGTYDREAGLEYNAAVLLSPDREAGDDHAVYRKTQLFPLTERVPGWLESRTLRERMPWLGSWSAGSGAALLELRPPGRAPLRIAPLICRDAVAPKIALDAARRGADLLVTLSNDEWFADTAGARLHLTVSAFRSIETRLPQLRATNTGISAVITPTGEIAAETPVDEPALLSGAVRPGARASTLMVAWGDWFGPLAAVIAAILLLLRHRIPRARRGSGVSSTESS